MATLVNTGLNEIKALAWDRQLRYFAVMPDPANGENVYIEFARVHSRQRERKLIRYIPSVETWVREVRALVSSPVTNSVH